MVPGRAAAVVISPLSRALLNEVPANSASGAAVVVRNCGAFPRLGMLPTSIVPAPAAAMLLTRNVMSAAAALTIGVMVPVGFDEAPAAGRPWKMLLAPPRMLTRSVERNVPPPPV